MAQALEGNLALELQFERSRPTAIGAGKLADLDHHISAFGPGVDQLAAQILAPRQFSGRHHLGDAMCFLHHRRGEFLREMILADDRKHIDAGSGRRAEHLNDFPLGVDVA